MRKAIPSRRYLPLAVALLLGVQLLSPSASAQIPAFGVISSHEMELEANQANLAGNSLDFFERRLADGTFKRYAVAATHGNGFDIIDVTNATDPETVGRYVNDGVGVYYHPWVQVNPRRNIVAISMEDPALSPDHGFSNGVEFIDVSDVTNPVQLGKVSGVGGPHTIRMIGDNHVYTTLPTHIIDYTDPTKPKDLGQNAICGHEWFPDPNIPDRAYVGICGNFGKWAIADISDPAHPVLIHEERDLKVEFAHEVYPAPDSSFVAVADFRGGSQTWTKCPGGGIHFYDISGKYIPGASLTNPERMGVWHAPFTGAAPVDPSTINGNLPNWGSCTMHSFQLQPERLLLTAGIYTGGSWVMDPAAATAPGGDYTEYKGSSTLPFGPTTWGNTKANFIAEGDFVNASQWLPFDIPLAKDHVYTNGLVRGVDVLHYHGAVPKKLSRLRIDTSAPGGVVSGVLDRYAVLTYEGWVNKPLAGKAVEIRAGGSTLTTTTGADGSFSADLGLLPGNHDVTVTWAGDDEFQTTSLTSQVTA